MSREVSPQIPKCSSPSLGIQALAAALGLQDSTSKAPREAGDSEQRPAGEGQETGLNLDWTQLPGQASLPPSTPSIGQLRPLP